MTAKVHQLFEPDKAVIRRFLGSLFEGMAKEYADGWVEIAWNPPGDGINRYKRFTLDRLDDAAEHVAAVNSVEGQNVYVGAALRLPDSPDRRGCDEDHYATFLAYSDFDQKGDADEAVRLYKEHDIVPFMGVTTGKVPHRRLQLWWRLREPITDKEEHRALMQQLALGLGGDLSVIPPKQIMRIGGTVSWRKDKPGRITEMTKVRLIDTDRSYYSDHEGFWSLPEHPKFQNTPEHETGAANSNWEDGEIVYETTHDGLLEERKIVDGREKWARKVTMGALIALVAKLERAPTINELYSEAWPTYREKIKSEVGGRGPNFFRAKCKSTIRRFEHGRIGGFETVEDCKRAHEKKEKAREQAGTEEPVTEINPTPYRLVSPKKIPRRRWIAKPHYQRQYTSVTVAAPKVGKSSITMVEAISIATGKTLFEDMPVLERTPVWVINLEDPREEIDRRFAGICRHYGITQDDLEGYLYTDSGRTLDFRVVAQEWGKVVYPVATDAIIEAIRERNIGVLLVDPLVRAHRVPENDNGLIDEVLRIFAHISDVTGCSTELVHHPRKTMGGQVTIEDIRGAGSIVGAVRSARVMNRITPELADTQGIDPKDRRRFVFVSAPESNMSLASSDGSWRELQSVDIGNGSLGEPGDSVGVAVTWNPKHPCQLLSHDQIKVILLELNDPTTESGPATSRYSASSKARSMSAAKVVENLSDVTKEAAKEIISAWIESGLLYEEEYKNGKRETKIGVFVDWNKQPTEGAAQ